MFVIRHIIPRLGLNVNTKIGVSLTERMNGFHFFFGLSVFCIDMRIFQIYNQYETGEKYSPVFKFLKARKKAGRRYRIEKEAF